MLALVFLAIFIKSDSSELEDDPLDIPVSVSVEEMVANGGKQCQSDKVQCPSDSYPTEPCGTRCWSNGNHLVTYEYVFAGVKCQVFGTNDSSHGSYDIFIDGELQETVNQQHTTRTQYTLQFTSKILPYANHTIKLAGKGSAFEISRITFWPSLRAKRINITEMTPFYTSWTTETDNAGGLRQKATNQVKNISTSFSKIWVYGTKSNSHNQIRIEFGSHINKTINVQNSNQVNSILLYESPEIPYCFHELKLTTIGEAMLAFVYIIDEPIPKPLDIPISISTFAITRVNTACSIAAHCPNNTIPNYPCGQNCWSDQKKAASHEYVFTGVRFQIYGTYDPNHGKYTVTLDNELLATIDQKTTSRYMYSVQYTSDIFPYATHTIKLQGNAFNDYEIFKFAYWPSIRSKRINITDITKTGGNWKKETDFIGGLREYSDGAGSCKVSFNASKFWIIGTKCSWHREADIKFGDFTGSFTEHQTEARKDYLIVYESPKLNFTYDDLIITTNGTVTINCIYYEFEPTPSDIPISIPIDAMNVNGDKQCSDTVSCPTDTVSLVPCGPKCWSNSPHTVTYEYSFIGVKFQVFGTNANNHKMFSLYLDGELEAKISEKYVTGNDNDRQSYAHLYTSGTLPYRKHSIKVAGIGQLFEISKFTYWVDLNAIRINTTEFQLANTWNRQQDSIGGFKLQTNEAGKELKNTIYCSKFWVIGTGSTASLKVKFGTELDETNELMNNAIKFALIYESPQLSKYYDDLLTFTTQTGGATINCIYQDIPPPPTQVFSRSDFFTESSMFSNSAAFTKTGQFSDSDKFTKSHLFSESDIFTKSHLFSESDIFSDSDAFPPSSIFTSSDAFTKSKAFTKTGEFSETTKFTESYLFSESSAFSDSDAFPPSSMFTNSDAFSESKAFTKTGEFSETTKFTESSLFSESSAFSHSNSFQPSSMFTHSDAFTKSNAFTETKEFSKTREFSDTTKFTESFLFSMSSIFSNSQQFSSSNAFSKSSSFTETNAFSKTGEFSVSGQFTRSNLFSSSDLFSKSIEFSSTNQFSTSNAFSKSSSFTETNAFSKTAEFSVSGQFTQSNLFSSSDVFSKSIEFSSSNQFSTSNAFSKSSSFTETNAFSKTDDFSVSGQFTQSNEFSTSNAFSKSSSFTETNVFSKTGEFSVSGQFTRSNLFSSSDRFSKSIEFSSTNQFSTSNAFSKSSSFTETNAFSKTDGFSVSEKFTQSNEFSTSGMFTKSNEFSNTEQFSSTNLFSNSNLFTETNMFTKTGDFSVSEKFTQSNEFSTSGMFTKSNEFSNTEQFTHTTHFSVSNKFSESQDFTVSGPFTLSNDFSKSQKFSESNTFSLTSKFSETLSFTISNKFSYSDHFSQSKQFSTSQGFTVSEGFSKSQHFSLTNEFSVSTKFTISEKFSTSDKFSVSDKFSLSQQFSKTNHFSYSNQFSHSVSFTLSEDFSISNKFTLSQYFSETEQFSRTKEFTETADFSKTEKFTISSKFSESQHFSESRGFSDSYQFTKSEMFSPSAELEIIDPPCGYWDNGTFTELKDCIFNVSDNKFIYINVLSSNFTDYNKEGNGTAIHIVNCGLNCNDTIYVDCVTTTGCGGAIYIKNTQEMTNNATFTDLLFLRCRANFGGAIFIQTQSILFDVSFTRCNFTLNEAYRKRPIEGVNRNFYGGGAIFMISKKSNILNCSFGFNKGSGVKIYDKFENLRSLSLNEDEGVITFIGCHFEKDENSKSSISYVDETNINRIHVNDCNFKGKLRKGSHYIDGKSSSKDKLNIFSCFFENNAYNEAVSIDPLNDVDLIIDLDKEINSSNGFNKLWKIVLGIIIFMLSLTLIIKKLHITSQLSDSNNESIESLIDDFN